MDPDFGTGCKLSDIRTPVDIPSENWSAGSGEEF